MALFSGLRTVVKRELGLNPSNSKQIIYNNLASIRNKLKITIEQLEKGVSLPNTYSQPFQNNLAQIIAQKETLTDKQKKIVKPHIKDLILSSEKGQNLYACVNFYQKVDNAIKIVKKKL